MQMALIDNDLKLCKDIDVSHPPPSILRQSRLGFSHVE